jgi:hypothetical protein
MNFGEAQKGRLVVQFDQAHLYFVNRYQEDR